MKDMAELQYQRCGMKVWSSGNKRARYRMKHGPARRSTSLFWIDGAQCPYCTLLRATSDEEAAVRGKSSAALLSRRRGAEMQEMQETQEFVDGAERELRNPIWDKRG